MKARLPGAPRHSTTHCHRPVKFTPCADALDVIKANAIEIAPNIVLIDCSSQWQLMAVRRQKLDASRKATAL